jgi:ATP-dependent DNA ligase
VITPPRRFVEPQFCKLAEKAPTGKLWVHEIKFDGYRIAARIDRGKVQLLTRSGLDWSDKYPETGKALAALPVKTAYLDGELCGVRDDGVTSFELMQQASDSGTGALVYFAFDLLEVDGDDIAKLPLLERKARLASILEKAPAGVSYSEHEGGDGEVFRKAACGHGLEGIVSKRTDRPYLPGDRGVWISAPIPLREHWRWPIRIRSHGRPQMIMARVDAVWDQKWDRYPIVSLTL